MSSNCWCESCEKSNIPDLGLIDFDNSDAMRARVQRGARVGVEGDTFIIKRVTIWGDGGEVGKDARKIDDQGVNCTSRANRRSGSLARLAF